MAIRRPTFYPDPWASDEAMDALTPDEMAAGYPAGTNDKPSRQSINGVLQYATNGVLYYLIRGVPEWMQAAEYEAHAIVIFADAYYMAVSDNTGQPPDTASTVWERLPWRRSELDAIYLSRAEAEARYLTLAQADQRFYTRAMADATFLRITDANFQFVTQAALDANYITRDQAAALFLTQAQGDARYARIGEVVTNTQLTSTLANYFTTEEANATLMTQAQADARFMTTQDAEATFLSQADAQANFLALVDAGLTVWRYLAVYPLGALVLDLESGIVYQSQQEGNTGNSVTDEAWWKPWVMTRTADTNGMFLHLLEFTGRGVTYLIQAEDIPLLALHPEGIFMKFVLKGHGGTGSVIRDWGNAAHGGGEAYTIEAVVRVQSDWFPLQITFTENDYVDRIDFVPTQYPEVNPTPGEMKGLTVVNGGNGEINIPGAGGYPLANYMVRFESNEVTYWRGIRGAGGRYGIIDNNGGDGGGSHGASGPPQGKPQTLGLYGCGGSGRFFPKADWALNCGGGVEAGGFYADGGVTWLGNPQSTYNNDSPIDLNNAGTGQVAPEVVYRSCRFGTDFTVQLGYLRKNAPHVIRLHMAEMWGGPAERYMNIYVNDVLWIENYSIVAAVGMYRAHAFERTFMPDEDGFRIHFWGWNAPYEALVCGIELMPYDNGGDGYVLAYW